MNDEDGSIYCNVGEQTSTYHRSPQFYDCGVGPQSITVE